MASAVFDSLSSVGRGRFELRCVPCVQRGTHILKLGAGHHHVSWSKFWGGREYTHCVTLTLVFPKRHHVLPFVSRIHLRYSARSHIPVHSRHRKDINKERQPSWGWHFTDYPPLLGPCSPSFCFAARSWTECARWLQRVMII